MKKIIKLLSVVVLTVAICFSLCSCIDVKAIRESQAYYTDETEQEITFGGKNYKKVENWPDDIEVFFSESGTVGDKKKPLLISAIDGDTMEYNEAREIVFISGSGFFCLTEKYDEIVASLNDIQLNTYCLKKFWSEGFFSDFKEELVLLDGEMVDAIKEVLKTVKPSNEYVETWEYVSVYKCDATKTFIDDDVIGISRTEKGKYYIEKTVYNEKEEYDETLYYRIPSKQEHIFKELVNNNADYI